MATALCVVHIFPLPPLRHLTHSDTVHAQWKHAHVCDGQEGPARSTEIRLRILAEESVVECAQYRHRDQAG
jgi:hypothetical protein